MNSELLLVLALVWSSLSAGWVFNANAQVATNGSSRIFVSDSNFQWDNSIGWDDLAQPSGFIPTTVAKHLSARLLYVAKQQS
jgi:hypothetical protein